MKIRLVCIEDGLENIGFRKIASYIKDLHSDTKAVYAPTGNKLGIIRTMVESDYGNLDKDDDIDKLSNFLCEGDVVGISSMTAYSPTVHKVIASIKKNKPETFVVWGGIHPSYEPQTKYPILFFLCRTSYLIKRALQHLRFLDFSYFPGKPGYYLWKLKIIQFWQKFMIKKYKLPTNNITSTS